MTPNRDAATRFPFASTTPVQWLTPSSNQRSSQAAMPITVSNCLSNQSLVRESVQSELEERREELNADSKLSTTAGLINAQQYLSQIYHLRQQALANEQNHERDAQNVDRSLLTPTNHSNCGSEKTRNLLQTFVTSAGNSNLLFSYGGQLSWPAASLAAIAANRQLAVPALNPEENMVAVQQNKFSGAIDPVLGNLLPPPPSLPVTSNLIYSQSRSPSAQMPFSITATSHAVNNSKSPEESISNFHTSSAIPQKANFTSNTSQPLDLSVARRQNLQEAIHVRNQNGVNISAAGRKLTSSGCSAKLPAVDITNNNNLPPCVTASYKPNVGSSSSATENSSITDQQHFVSTSLIQSNNQLPISLLQREKDINSNLQKDSLQQWIYATQLHQHSANEQSKRLNSVSWLQILLRCKFYETLLVNMFTLLRCQLH